MSFWDVLLRRPNSHHAEVERERAELHKSIAQNKKAIEAVSQQIERTQRNTTAVEVAAQALTAVVRGSKGQ